MQLAKAALAVQKVRSSKSESVNHGKSITVAPTPIPTRRNKIIEELEELADKYDSTS